MITIEAKNLGNLMNMANSYPAIAQKYVDKAIVISIGMINRKTQPHVPVRTGNLKNSFFPQFQPFVGWFGSIVSYGLPVSSLYTAGTHYKYQNIPAKGKWRPKNLNAIAGFLDIGAQEAKSDIDEAFSNALNNIVSELYTKL